MHSVETEICVCDRQSNSDALDKDRLFPGQEMRDVAENKEMNKRIRQTYVTSRCGAVCFYLLTVAVFFGLAALYGYIEVVRNMVYGMELTAFFGALMIFIDYRSYRTRCYTLIYALQKEVEQSESLPEAKNLPEELYQQMILEGERERRELRTRYDEKQREMADYYTMWTHQIKTPIAALRLLQQDQQGQTEADRLRESEELFKIEQYAGMALYFARLDSPSSDFVFSGCDVRDIVKQAVRKYSVLFLRSGLSFRIEEFALQAVTDEKWLGFVVEQVFSNALKYTRQGGIAIYGADREGDQQQGMVSYLVIEDTGIGIEESDLPRIFERGFTGYNGRMEQRSTGLGLYLCERIMRKMSHTIRVESIQGEGTKVILGFVQE